MNEPNTQRVVVCAANKSKVTGRIICGARHWDSVMRSHCVVDSKIEYEWKAPDQGFIDQHGVWMDRKEALAVATAAGQIKHKHGVSTLLFSEDLY